MVLAAQPLAGLNPSVIKHYRMVYAAFAVLSRYIGQITYHSVKIETPCPAVTSAHCAVGANGGVDDTVKRT
jgi:hypothetical protein